jgi:hypothetical protein
MRLPDFRTLHNLEAKIENREQGDVYICVTVVRASEH